MDKFVCVVILSVFCTLSCQGKLGNSTFNWDKEFPFNWRMNEDIVAYVIQSEKCPKNIPLQPEIFSEISSCLQSELTEDFFNETLIMLESGHTKIVGSTVCRTLPKVNSCYTKLFAYLDECHDWKIQAEQMINGVISNFLCSSRERMEYIGMFLYHFMEFFKAGGLSCLGMDDLTERFENGEDIKAIMKARLGDDLKGFMECMDDFQGIVLKEDDICTTIQNLRNCGKSAFFRKCGDSPKPWEKVAAGFNAFEDVLSCRNIYRSFEL